MEIKNKTDYLWEIHNKVRKESENKIREVIEYCKTIELDDFDHSSIETRGKIKERIRTLVNESDNLLEIAGILFEFDTMADYRIRNEKDISEHINNLIRGYELGTYKR